MTTVTAPGLWELEEAAYHADTALTPELGRSLSYSGAKTLLRAPALFDHQREHGRADTDEFDFGHAAHKYILGVGEQVVRVNAKDWRTKAAQEAKAKAREAGHIPLLLKDVRRALNMAKAVKRHPVVKHILSDGEPERSAFWIDQATGITCRARFDWLRSNAIVDVKTTQDASPSAFAKAVERYRYDMQAAWYQDGALEVTGQLLPFVFIAVEKDPPHLLAVYTLDETALQAGRASNAEARATFAECESSGQWPGYGPEIRELSLSRWHTDRFTEVTL